MSTSRSQFVAPGEDIAALMARQLAAQGQTAAQIQRELVSLGVNPGIAAFMAHQHRGAPRLSSSQAGQRDMFMGGAILLLGSAITSWSYFNSMDTGEGRYFLTIGAFVFGTIQFL